MNAQLIDTALAVAPHEEPVQWAVVMLFDGEVLGSARELFTSGSAVAARAAELRRRFPRHEIRVVRRTVVWTDEGGVA